MQKNKIYRISLFIIFLIIAITSFLYNLKTSYIVQEAISINNPFDYSLSATYTTTGTFVDNNKVDVRIVMQVVQGEDFRNLSEFALFVGKIGDEIYRYPIQEINNIKIGSKLDDIIISKDYRTLTGKTSVIFLTPKDYSSYSVIFRTNDGNIHHLVSQKNIKIESKDVLYNFLSSKWILITGILGFIISLLNLLYNKV